MTDDPRVDLSLRRGTKGRVVGWLVICPTHGTLPTVGTTKKRAERVAVDHGKQDHSGAFRVRVPR